MVSFETTSSYGGTFGGIGEDWAKVLRTAEHDVLLVRADSPREDPSCVTSFTLLLIRLFYHETENCAA